MKLLIVDARSHRCLSDEPAGSFFEVFDRRGAGGLAQNMGQRGYGVGQQRGGNGDNGIPGQDGVRSLLPMRPNAGTFQFFRAGILPPAQAENYGDGLGHKLGGSENGQKSKARLRKKR